MRPIPAHVASLFALLFATVLAVVGILPAVASAASAPYTDPNSVGFLGFCNGQGQQVTSGSITAAPFANLAVSSSPAPPHYGPPLGRAVLYAYQPIQYVDPSNWSGKQLTGATAYSNPKAPMAVGTPLDSSIVNFSSVFPLHLDGFAQVRMFFTASGQTEFSTTYPSADIKITGNTWTQVGGGKVNCKAGQARSNEIAPGAPTTFPTHSTSKSASSTTARSSGSSSKASSTAGGSGAATSPAGSAIHKSSGSSGGGLVAVLVVLVVLVGGGAGYVLLRRRNSMTG